MPKKPKKLRDPHSYHTHVWRHNSLYGQTCMALRNLRNMMSEPSVTQETRAAISLVLKDLQRVSDLIRTKRDDSDYFGRTEADRDVTPPSIEELLEKRERKG